MTSPSCPRADTPRARRSGRRRVASLALAATVVAMVVLGETWAIEHASILVDQGSPTLASEVVRVFGDASSDSGAPIAIVH